MSVRRAAVPFLAALLLLASAACQAASAARAALPPVTGTVHLTSLEWPPYTGQRLARQGITTAVLKAAMASMGYQVEVTFYPWARATALVRAKSIFIGYFPEYDAAQTRADYLLSDPIGTGPLGFAEHADTPVKWETLDDLERHRIGLVAGYVNSEAFDQRVAAGRQRVDYARDDQQNLVKLAAGRVPLALVDRRVFDFLTRHDRAVAPLASKLRFHARLLENKQLYVCFRRTAEGERMRKIFNEGLKKIDVEAVMQGALRQLDGNAGPG